MSQTLKRYRIHTALQDFEGTKSGRVYTCTREATYIAPQGEFKELGREAYSLLGEAPSAESPGEGAGADESAGAEKPADDGPATTDSSDNDDASSSPTDSTA
jgi:hypothetical protein